MLNIPLGVPNAKYLAFGNTNTKNQSSLGISNLKNFGMKLQYNLKCETVRTSMSKFFLLISFTSSLFSQYISLSIRLQHISLSLSVWFSHHPLYSSFTTPRRSHHATDHHTTLPSFIPSHAAELSYRHHIVLSTTSSDLSQLACSGGFCF